MDKKKAFDSWISDIGTIVYWGLAGLGALSVFFGPGDSFKLVGVVTFFGAMAILNIRKFVRVYFSSPNIQNEKVEEEKREAA